MQGSHGLMRFSRDIHHTVKEDKTKVEYGRQELDVSCVCNMSCMCILMYITYCMYVRIHRVDV